MRKKQKLFLGITFFLTAAIFTGCVNNKPVETILQEETIPPETILQEEIEPWDGKVFSAPDETSNFFGEWERVNQSEFTNTLTINSDTIQADNQQTTIFNITKISGDLYTISQSDNPRNKGTITLRLDNDNLEIIDAYDAPSVNNWRDTIDDWTGAWRRR